MALSRAPSRPVAVSATTSRDNDQSPGTGDDQSFGAVPHEAQPSPDLLAQAPQQCAVGLTRGDPGPLPVRGGISGQLKCADAWLDNMSNASPYCASSSRVTIGNLGQ
jgi:hypothetical protein